MHEPATAITDLLLAMEAAAVAIFARRTRTSNIPLRGSTLLLFWALAFAALLGFITHGFVANHTSTLFAVLWRTLLLSVAVAGAATWVAAGQLWPSLRLQRIALLIAGISLLALAALIVVNVRRWAEGYNIAIASYAPAMLFLLISFIAARRRRAALSVTGSVGVLLSFLAAVVQQSNWHIGPVDHNALYHLIQALGLLMIFLALRAAMRPHKWHSTLGPMAPHGFDPRSSA
jgi:hypothetical protein